MTKEEKQALKEQKRLEKEARKAEKAAEKARRKALKDGTLKAEEPDVDPDAPDPLRPRTEEELATELEDLKNMVQGELDKMKEEAPDADWKDFVDAALYEKKNGIKPDYHRPEKCEICGENDAVEGEKYCEQCLDDMKHYPFEWWQFIIPIMAVFFLVFGILLGHQSWSLYQGTASAQSLARQGKLSSALDAYGTLNGTIEDEGGDYGVQYRKNQVKILNKTGVQNFGLLSNYLESYYPTDLNKWYNSYARKAQANIDDYQKAYEYLEEAAQNAESQDDYKAVLKSYNETLKDKDVNTAYANFFRYDLALMYDQSYEEQKKYVDAIAAEGKEYESLYLPLQTEIALGEKEYATALDLADQMEAINKEDIYVYVFRSVAYRMQGELGLAADAADAGLKIDGSASTLNYQRAILFLLEGDLTLASAYAEEAHTNAATAGNYISACSLYSLILQEQIAEKNEAIKSATGDAKDKLKSEKADLKSTYDSLMSEFDEYGAAYGYEISPDVNKILKGKKTVEEVFLKGTGDFS